MLKRRRPAPKSASTKAQRAANAEASFSADGGYTINYDLLLTSFDAATKSICPGVQKDVFKKCRGLLSNEFVGSWIGLRRIFFDDGLRPHNRAALKDWLEGKGKAVWSMLVRLNADLWSEWLLQDNAVVFWIEPFKNQTPKPMVLDCEVCKYSNEFGAESLKVTLPRKTDLTDAQKEALGPRWAAAYRTGKEIELKPEEGERFRVLTRAKAGHGLGMPRLRQALRLLGIFDNLRTADWGGSWKHRDVIEQIKVGHEIRNGDRAGLPDHFINKEKRRQIEEQTKNKTGPRQSVTNFDVEFLWKYLDPEFFKATKFDATLAGLDRFGGPGMMLLAGGTQSANAEFLARAFAAEGRHDRNTVGGLLNDLLADRTFLPMRPPVPLQVGWNPHTFRDSKQMLDLIRFASGQGAMSMETTRESLDLDHRQEGDRLVAERNDQNRNTPYFEQKQGMTEPGRPGNTPPSE